MNNFDTWSYCAGALTTGIGTIVVRILLEFLDKKDKEGK